MSNSFRVVFEIAEVIDVEQIRTGENQQNLYSVSAEIYNTSTVQHDVQVRPASINMQTPPTVGEIILIFNGPNQYSGQINTELQWYYLCTLPIQSSIYKNVLPSTEGSNVTDNVLPDKIINPLQSFAGDTLIQGRFGNSIRLGSSPIPNDISQTSILPNWSGNGSMNKLNSDPIIILSNTSGHTSNSEEDPYGRKYTVENLDTDVSSLYLTTTQRLTTLKLNKNTNKSGGYLNYDKSQLIGTADRITLTSKSNNIILDSSNRISLNANEILLGDESATEPMVHGKELITILGLIMDEIEGGTFGSGGIYSLPALGKISQARQKLSKLTSKKYFMKK
jgi:hypothetical protein